MSCNNCDKIEKTGMTQICTIYKKEIIYSKADDCPHYKVQGKRMNRIPIRINPYEYQESTTGDYICYDEYEQLERELREVKEELLRSHDLSTKLVIENHVLKEKLNQLESEAE